MERTQVVIPAGEMDRQREFTARLAALHQQRERRPLAMVETYGCQQNVADSQRIMGMLREMGCVLVREAAEAERAGEAILSSHLASIVEPYGTVSSTLCSSRLKDGVLLVTLSAECVEEIGTRVPIYTEEPGQGP